MQVPQNDEDLIILKTNGIPTYHFAHVIDDKLMGTTLVIRGEEWLSSIGRHLELWKSLGWNAPKYGHIMPIMKQDGSSIRKLSKRKDPEADVMTYEKDGYPEDSIIGYLYRLANPSFDDWWQCKTGEQKSVRNFPFSMEELKRGGRGPLLDIAKLNDISGDVISGMTAIEVADRMIKWGEKFAPEFVKVVSRDRQYFERILDIERAGDNPRKDIVNWSTGVEATNYFFDDFYNEAEIKKTLESVQGILSPDLSNKIITEFSDDKYYSEDSLDQWLENVKSFAESAGFAIDRKKFKENPALYKGDFAMLMKTIRLAITGRDRTPNMFYLLKVMGKPRVVERLKKILN
jgi:glutamyl-tRNA synthetase